MGCVEKGADKWNIYSETFETYFDRSYTLKKLTTEAYIRDPRFEALTFCAYKPATGETYKARGAAIAPLLNSFDWGNIHFFAHHSQFDGLILSHHYGIHPAMLGCTLSMARPLGRDRTGDGLSLKSLAEKIGSHPKTVDYGAFMGKRGHQLTDDALAELEEQCLEDCMLTYDLFDYFMCECAFPPDELVVIDETIKMFTSPVLAGDVERFEGIALKEISRKTAILNKLNVSRAQLASAAHCKELLESLGVEVAMKNGKNGLIPALAKSDNFLQSLLDDENEVIREVAEARMNVKSTLVETRAQRFAEISKRGAIPIYLRYCGAHTMRWSGGDKSNAQNFTRKGDLRSGIVAPNGAKLIIVDYEQIEARLLLRLAGQYDQLEYFARGEDLYRVMAARVYGIDPADVTPEQRGLGKQLVLACGYGAGAYTIQRTAKSGQYTNGIPLILTLEQAEAAKTVYRECNKNVVKLWYWGEDVLRYMLSEHKDKQIPDDFFLPIRIEGRVVGAHNGLALDYASLEAVPLEEGELGRQFNAIKDKDGLLVPYSRLTVKHRHEITNIYGGKFIENLVQFLARVIVSDSIVSMRQDHTLDHLKICLTSHDELVFICEDDKIDDSIDKIEYHMIKPVKWLSGLPLAVKTTVSQRYGK